MKYILNITDKDKVIKQIECEKFNPQQGQVVRLWDGHVDVVRYIITHIDHDIFFDDITTSIYLKEL